MMSPGDCQMRTICFVTALLLAVGTISDAQARPGVGRRGPPDGLNVFICKIAPQQGGGFCTTVPYAHLGVACSCDGGRKGVVSTR
jgi:hypothetical protein